MLGLVRAKSEPVDDHAQKKQAHTRRSAAGVLRKDPRAQDLLAKPNSLSAPTSPRHGSRQPSPMRSRRLQTSLRRRLAEEITSFEWVELRATKTKEISHLPTKEGQLLEDFFSLALCCTLLQEFLGVKASFCSLAT